MGNTSSAPNSRKSSHSIGVYFVSWRASLNHAPNALDSQSATAKGDKNYHFAEASSYRYDKARRSVTSTIVFTDPPKADGPIVNRSQLLGCIAVVERGGRVHFPDIVRKVVQAGAVGCIFIERTEESAKEHSLFDGFHSSGRQTVPVPVVLLSKTHADRLLQEQPTRVKIELLTGDDAMQHIVPDDVYCAVPSAARAGDVSLLTSLLFSDPSGAVLERLPKAAALCEAAEQGHVDCLEVLQAFGLSPDEQKPNGTSALMVAASVGNIEALRALLLFGANLDLEDVHGMTALMFAARDGQTKCLKLLARKGARVNLSRNRTRGMTALHIAARGGFEDCVAILLGSGAELDLESPNGTTALMEAARAGNLECVRLLIDAGTRLDAKDPEGKTAQEIAHTTDYTEIEDLLRERAESESVKEHRRRIEESMSKSDASLHDLLLITKGGHVSVDILQHELSRDPNTQKWLEQPTVIYEVFRLLTLPASENGLNLPDDPYYGKYKVQHFCSEIAFSYTRRIFMKNRSSNATESPESLDDIDLRESANYLKVLFSFICQPGPLDEVLLVLFCKVIHHFLLTEQLGGLFLHFLAHDGQFVMPWLVRHVGMDTIRDTLVWLLYSDLTEQGQENLQKSKCLDCLFDRLYSLQRTMSWGVGTPYQRDTVENICAVLNYILYPPSVYMLGSVVTFVDNTDNSLPLITDQHYPHRHNTLLRSLLVFLLESSHVTFETLIDLGYAELKRQCEQPQSLVVHEAGALSVVMMLMSQLGYHRRRRDFTGVESLLKSVHTVLLFALIPRVDKFVELCRLVVMKETSANDNQRLEATGTTLLSIIAFLKRCVFLQSGQLDELLANGGLMPCFLACYGYQKSNSLLHHELTDVIRFVLMNPDQKRLPMCPLLNALFADDSNLLDFVMKAYEGHAQYKGHMTTIANSIFTLTNTPDTHNGTALTVQEVVRQYTQQHAAWQAFGQTLADQNAREMQPLGQRNAPVCNACFKLKEFAIEHVQEALSSTQVAFQGYLETLFSGAPSHYCKIENDDDFLTGFLYKKDKIHDHVPIPEPTHVSSFVQFPVPMPFHALTFTLTFVGLCRKCDKLWYCDTLQSPNWATRMKWVVPTAVRKWYSFGVTAGPGSGAHGIQFSTKGYKSFIVLLDTWGRQEQWMRAIDSSVAHSMSQASRSMDRSSALGIDLDNDEDPDFDDTLSEYNRLYKAEQEAKAEESSDTTSESSEDKNRQTTPSNDSKQGLKSTKSHRTLNDADKEAILERRSKSVSSSLAEMGKADVVPGYKVNRAYRHVDLTKFQPDGAKLAQLLASPPRVHHSRPPASADPVARKGRPHADSLHVPSSPLTTSPGPDSRSRASSVASTSSDEFGIRHVVSTPELSSMQ